MYTRPLTLQASMTRATSILVILAVAIQYINSAVISGLYCKDPDTEKFYPLGTKWPSTTFCGTYTCTLKKRNMTKCNDRTIPKNEPSLAYNVASTEMNPPSDMDSSNSDIVGIINADSRQEKEDNLADSILKANKDRYLNQDEIMAITKVLHTIRKSELESLLEIYNIAQDIYKDVDKETLKSVPQSSNPTYSYNTLNPYWYIHRKDTNQLFNQNVPTGHIYPNAPQYLGNSAKKTNKVFLKDCYYKSPYRGAWAMKTVVGPWVNRKIRKPYQFSVRERNNPQHFHYPYSFLFNNNLTNPNDVHINEKTWSNINANGANEEPSTKILTKKSAEPKGTEQSTEHDTLSVVPWKTDALTDQVLDDVKANWLKKSYSDKFFDTLLEKSSLWNPKAEKLEKVGTVIRVDDLIRKRRDAEESKDEKDCDHEEFHVHFVAHRCDTAAEVGFFRVGNTSEPFPQCCPQKIQKQS